MFYECVAFFAIMAAKRTAKKTGAGPKRQQKLTDKQRVFVEEYLTCWNATEAARRAGYSPHSIRQIAQDTLSKLYIREEIERRIAEKTMKTDEVLLRLAEQARGEQSRFWIIDSKGKPILDLQSMVRAGMMHLVKEVKTDPKTGSVIEVKFHDSQAALRLLGTHLKLFTERTELTGKDGGAIQYEDVGLTDEERAARIAALFERARERGA